MNINHHINIVDTIIDNINNNAKNKYYINRTIFKLGSIVPCIKIRIYRHNIDNTINKLEQSIHRAYKFDGVVRSYYFGTISHYIGDCFCYINNSKLGLGNINKYQKQYYVYYKNLINYEVDKDSISKYNDIFNSVKRKVVGDNDTLDYKLHNLVVVEQLKEIHKQYIIDYSNMLGIDNLKENLIKLDNEYALLVSTFTILNILEPVRCLTIIH